MTKMRVDWEYGDPPGKQTIITEIDRDGEERSSKHLVDVDALEEWVEENIAEALKVFFRDETHFELRGDVLEFYLNVDGLHLVKRVSLSKLVAGPPARPPGDPEEWPDEYWEAITEWPLEGEFENLGNELNLSPDESEPC
jgi:hypothetical protein